mmetsp:Transcript_22805/g.25384  ORF Transcript_22805/g.25384 Transcript_22805/m.25384 type:complete len:477 (+) Transcript_22805:18-1448(+)
MSRKKGKRSKYANQDDTGTLFVTAIAAKNLAGAKKGTSDPYCRINSTFNKQQFKTKVLKRNREPEWDQTFKFYTTQLTGHVHIKIYDKDRWSSDLLLGEVALPLKSLAHGERVEEWYQLQNEPKKKKKKGELPGEVQVRLHYPSKKPKKKPSSSSKGTAEKKETSSNPTPREKTDEGRRKVPIRDIYDFGKELGKGGFSVVKEAVEKETKARVAVKIIEKSVSEEELQLLQREIDIMRKLKHDNIISLLEVFDDKDFIYLVLELVTGGELFDQIINRGAYSERDAANITKQILHAIQYMHENGVAHRDLKPENLLCSGPNNDLIKVTDFGLSKDFGQATLKTSCGTPDYVAPEVLKGLAYDHSVDIWSIGVIAYILLCGFPPFYGKNDQIIFEKILAAEFDFPSPDWDNISEEAKNFIKSILVLDVNKRPDASQCLDFPWIKTAGGGSTPAAYGLKRLETFRGQMKKYNATRRTNH